MLSWARSLGELRRAGIEGTATYGAGLTQVLRDHGIEVNRPDSAMRRMRGRSVNALAETIDGLYKAELIHRPAPWQTKESVELARLERVAWLNNHRLLAPIGDIPPAQAEANYHKQFASQDTAVVN